MRMCVVSHPLISLFEALNLFNGQLLDVSWLVTFRDGKRQALAIKSMFWKQQESVRPFCQLKHETIMLVASLPEVSMKYVGSALTANHGPIWTKWGKKKKKETLPITSASPPGQKKIGASSSLGFQYWEYTRKRWLKLRVSDELKWSKVWLYLA